MADNWLRYCCDPDMECGESHVVVRFSDERRQKVMVDERDNEYYLLSAFVIRQAAVASLPALPLQIWLRNRATSLVGFRIDSRGRLVGEALVPKVGLTAEEFRIYVRTVAVECDRLEYLLTGGDQE